MSAVSKNAQQASGFDPRNISNCTLWLDAADTRTVTGTTTVTAWADKSGNGFNATTATGAPSLTSNALNSKSVLTFGGSTYMTTTLSLATTQAFTLFAVARPSDTGVFRTVAAVNANGATRPANVMLYRASNNNWWMSGGTGATDGTTTTLTASTSRYDINANYWAPNSTQVNVNGTSYASSSSAPSTLTGSATFLVAASQGLGERWNGNIAEIILFSATLTQSQRQQVEGYLAWKWGIQAQLPTHPYLGISPFLRQPFSPTNFSNCCCWLDASDRSSFTLSGSTVISIFDKADGNVFTVGGTPTWSSTGFNSAYGGFTMTNGRFIKSISSLTTYQHTAFIVTKLNSTPTAGWPCVAFAGSTAGSSEFYRVLDYTAAPAFRTIAFTSSLFSTTTSYTTNNIIFSGIFDGSRAISSRLFTGTENSFSVSGTGNAFTTNGGAIMIGTDGTSPGTNTWPGVIAEVIVYRNVNLNNDQRRLIEGYLSWKWGIPANLPSTHLYYNFWPSTFGTTTLSPLSITGCQLWLDASDASTVTVNSSSQVTAWLDKSSNGRSGAFSAGRNFTYGSATKNSRYVIQTASGQSMTIASFALGATMTIFHVYMPISQSSGSAFIELGPDTNSNNGFYFQAQTNFNFAIRNSGTTSSTNFGTTAVSNTWQIMGGINKDTNASNTMSFYTDGTLRASGGNTSTNVTVTDTLNINGRNNGNVQSFPTYIAEIIIYNVALTNSQRQVMEGYLAWKWGLTSLLPSGHPYKSVEPTTRNL